MLLRTTTILLTLAYPFLVYWGLHRFDALALLPVLLVILGMRWLGGGGQQHERLVIVGSALGVAAVTLGWGARLGLQFYPVLVNLSLLLVFGGSLFGSRTVIERLARLREPDLPPEGVAYTRKVTQAWCVFFALNGAVSAGTMLWASPAVWALYNGLIAYLLIGLMLAGEWVIRRRVRSAV
ncbi:hypothetical protein [Oceanimonas doudoroffii]|uniref:DNA gyrase subunit B n=1 Tax=Oceanimonas doudoroffii TaxID=84158 RepID=A0A233RCC2_9GAMM|nr:hypothetical protein [Oceanimonas doudoroffii]OXY81028.1 hypothetical protein B6S08_15015 [Oceanimonas doudoroffii]